MEEEEKEREKKNRKIKISVIFTLQDYVPSASRTYPPTTNTDNEQFVPTILVKCTKYHHFLLLFSS